jgi:deoxyribodipyrimidine photo-lyase
MKYSSQRGWADCYSWLSQIRITRLGELLRYGRSVTALVWFRRDLRLHDNPALHAALVRHDTVVPLFCLDDRLLNGRHRSAPRAAFLRSCLVSLDEALHARGSTLLIRSGPPEQLIPALAQALYADEVFAAEDVGPFARRRDEAVAKALDAVGIRLHLRPGVFTVDDLGSIRTGAGSPYTVFTPFHRRWLSEPRRPVRAAPHAMPSVPEGAPTGQTLPDFGELPPQCRCPGGEPAARERMERFLGVPAVAGAAPVAAYADRHDTLGDPGTSELSPYLHLGCLSPRELESRLPDDAGGEALRRQLCWRDFYAHVLLHHPGNAAVEHQPRYRGKIRWTRSERLFDAWRDGRTGYPLVDAGMRELAQTGWMHNRARMVVGSFLVKDLGIDWRWGERWFMRALIDGDEANNNGNWQWIASVGVDPQPPARRIFNPTLQQRRYDPEGDYVRRHVPELERVPDDYLAEPWKMSLEIQRAAGCVIGVDYPAPIVDHAVARQEAIARYAAATSEAEAG